MLAMQSCNQHTPTRSHHSGIRRPSLAASAVSDWVQDRTDHLQGTDSATATVITCQNSSPRKLRSRGVNILQNNATALDFSKRAFCHASPTVWNSLPQPVISDLTITTGTFKQRLKSAMYTRAFLQWHVTPTLAILHNPIVNDLTCF